MHRILHRVNTKGELLKTPKEFGVEVDIRTRGERRAQRAFEIRFSARIEDVSFAVVANGAGSSDRLLGREGFEQVPVIGSVREEAASVFESSHHDAPLGLRIAPVEDRVGLDRGSSVDLVGNLDRSGRQVVKRRRGARCLEVALGWNRREDCG